MTSDKLILALDLDDPAEALKWVRRFQENIGVFKIGLQMFSTAGPDLVKEVRGQGAKVFLDLKFHDIPNTVAKAVEAVNHLDVQFLTIHTMGGTAMMKAAVNAAAPSITLLGVTVLTHHTEDDLSDLGFDHSVQGQVMQLARLAANAGVPGLVCSPLEVELLRGEFPKMKLVTPGVRPKDAELGDQKRVLTPAEAIAKGSDHLVIGRPILKAEDPEGAVTRILEDLEGQSGS